MDLDEVLFGWDTTSEDIYSSFTDGRVCSVLLGVPCSAGQISSVSTGTVYSKTDMEFLPEGAIYSNRHGVLTRKYSISWYDSASCRQRPHTWPHNKLTKSQQGEERRRLPVQHRNLKHRTLTNLEHGWPPLTPREAVG